MIRLLIPLLRKPINFLISFLLIIYSGNLFSQTKALENHFSFNHISVDDGLSNGYISSIVQDQQGFIWISTWDGLNRYDGYNFKIFNHNPLDSTTISSDNIRSQLITKDGTLWVGTDNGVINRYEPSSETFTRFKVDNINNSTSYDRQAGTGAAPGIRRGVILTLFFLPDGGHSALPSQEGYY